MGAEVSSAGNYQNRGAWLGGLRATSEITISGAARGGEQMPVTKQNFL